MPFDDRFERGVELVDADLGEEPEAAEIDAEDRHVAARLRDSRRHAEQRAVAAHDDDQIDMRAAAPRASATSPPAPLPASAAVSVSNTASMCRSRSQAASRSRWSAAAAQAALGDDADARDAAVGARRRVMRRGGGGGTRRCPSGP